MTGFLHTKCDGSLEGDVFVCKNPVISYGSYYGGIPSVHPKNDYTKWCEEMGFGVTVGPIQSKEETLKSNVLYNGWVFWCSTHDNSNWHWCDTSDGHWLNEVPQAHGSGKRVTEVKCRLKNNEVPGCLTGN